MKTITIPELFAGNGTDQPHIVDVRSAAEYRTVHVPNARHVPLERVSPEAVRGTRPDGMQGPTYVICKTGARARKAIEKLNGHGHDLDLVLVEGGTDAAVQAGVDVVRGKQAMSLERQVRIAAGALVALGVAGGVWISPWVLIVPAFVGCGLVFAGVTDTCGMGMLLARMPWNTATACATGTCSMK